MAENNDPFGRSSKTCRSPVQQIAITELSETNVLDPSAQSCKLCKELDTVDMVRCDECHNWFHFVCVGVDTDVENRDWSCEDCLKKRFTTQPSSNIDGDRKSLKSARSSNTQKSTTSSAAKRKQLALERVEEDRRLREARDKEYLDQKYKTLEDLLSDDSDGQQVKLDDDVLTENAREYTHQWVEGQSDIRSAVCQSNVNNPPEGYEVLTSTNTQFPEMLTSTEYSAGTNPQYRQQNFKSVFWQDYHGRLAKILNKSKSIQDSAQPNHSVSVNNLQMSMAQPSTARMEMNETHVASVTSSSEAPRITNSADVNKATNGQSKNRRQTTYSIFTNQEPIMNSSVVNIETRNRSVNQFTSVKGKKDFVYLDEEEPSQVKIPVVTGPTSQVPLSSIQNPYHGNQSQSNISRQPLKFKTPTFGSQNTKFAPVKSQDIRYTSIDNGCNAVFSQEPQNIQPTNSTHYQEFQQYANGGYTNSTSIPQQPILISLNGNEPTRSVVISRPSFQYNSNFDNHWTTADVNGPSMSFRPQNTYSGLDNPRGNDTEFTTDGRTSSRLEPRQIAARQAMPKSLPKFNGEPKDWPQFISAYENSTSACGYSNSENMGRLLDCLEGDAKEAVRSILLYPESAPEAMQTLKLMFGRPELVIEALLDELKMEPSPKENDLSALIKFAIKVRNLVAVIRKMGPLDHLQNPLLIKVLVDKLPTQTRINWAYFKNSNPHSNLASLGDWLYGLAQVTSQVVGRPKVEDSKKDRKDNQKSQNTRRSHVNVHVDNSSINRSSVSDQQSQNSRQCPICSLKTCKQIEDCSKLRGLKPPERWNIIKERKLCYSCFGKHRHFRCRSKKKCDIDGCQSTHHVLLHDSERQISTPTQQKSSPSLQINSKKQEKKSISIEGTNSAPKNCNSLRLRRGPAIFRIVPVILYSRKKAIRTFAYLDEGSDLSLVERELANELGLIGMPDYLNVRWAIKNTDETAESEIVSLRISGDFRFAPNYKVDNIFTVDELFLPSQSITRDWLDAYPHLKNLPISKYEDEKPRILLGLHCSKLTISQESIEAGWYEPIACRTRLGWVVQGPDEMDESEPVSNTKVSLNICECHVDNQLHNLVKEFFSFESFGIRISEKLLESKETARARKIMESTTVKRDGRFETGLLWKYDDIHLPDSYGMALKRLNCLEKKMEKDPSLTKKLRDYIEDFVVKKYIRKLLPHEVAQTSPRTWYLPIFVVFNPKKPLKVRTVWDAAAKVKNVSLNSVLLKGPDQLVPLPDVLRRFRERLFGITGDIGEMYHRIGVIEEDRCAQRFLWRDGESNRKPDVYVMEVLTFGSACSPSSAQFVKNKNALEYKNKFPRAVEAIVENTYIDDMLDCAHTIDEAICLAKDARFIHKQASFELGKFVSNSTEILQALGSDDNPQIKSLNLSSEATTERVLGMFWNTTTDTFTYSLKYAKIDEMVMTGNRTPTKREVLRALMSIFDPLGLIANVLVYAKILLQRIWRKSTGWDEKISESLQVDWLSWIQYLPQVEKLEIPRLYSPKLSPHSPKSIQIHTFVDAGMEACAAVTYLRIDDEFGVDCVLVGAKTKVAPNKPLTVPRLELQAAVLGTRLATSIGQSQRFKADKRFFWSDSKTVLSWIMSETRKYNQFVAFRVGEILDNSIEDEWNWVSTTDNVADEATKSKNKPEISSSSRWFKGPSFLYQPEEQWSHVIDKKEYVTNEELRPRYLLAQFVNKNENIINPNDFSSWRKLHRTMAYVLRFIDNLKLKKKNRITGPLSRQECIRAENRLYQQAQNDCFSDEMVIIRHNSTSSIGKQKDFDKSSILKTCSPYIDEFGVLRMKGRIDAAKHLSDQTKRPIILSRTHRITKLIINDYHRKFHHLNHQTTLNELHLKYFIPSLRRGLKSVIHNICQRCKNDRANPKVPEMADLPPARVATFTRPFTFVGIDYFGPFLVKVNTTKKKRWGVLVTCLTTRAIHIEVADALTTSECIMAISRFTGRRGTPAEFYSDNGTNFHGSEKELRTEFQKLNLAKIEETFTNSVSQWSFNPPLAAHFGGSWERMIRTVKSLLKKSMPTRTVTARMFETYLIEAEYIINSRPLTYVHLDHSEDEVLTPNHFLLGSSGGVRTPGTFNEACLLKDDWKAVQHMTDLFWRRFNVEYLPTLTRRTKWFKEVKPVEVGDVVVVVDDKNPRNTWPKGIVEEVYPGRGNRVRQAKIRLVRGRDNLSKTNVKNIKHQSLVRPVAKLAVLDVRQDELTSSSEAINGREDVANAP